jgi:hypothetical protein
MNSLLTFGVRNVETHKVIGKVPRTRLNLAENLIRELIDCVVDKLTKICVFLWST